jgi:hypothetical protein
VSPLGVSTLRRNKRFRSRARRRLLWFGGVVCLLGALTAYIAHNSRSRAGRLIASRAAAQSLAKRPVFPYSVISGGAYTSGELAEAVAGDPVARAHYADFNVERARPETLAKDRMAYVSYRRSNAVYWTSRPVPLKRGEVVLNDGASLARARCGNRISETPQAPTAAEEPAPEVLDMPEPPVLAALPREQSANQLDPVATPAPVFPEPPPPPQDIKVVPPSPPQRPAIIIPRPYALPPRSRTPIEPVPEPGSFILLATGVAAASLYIRRMRRH